MKYITDASIRHVYHRAGYGLRDGGTGTREVCLYRETRQSSVQRG